ncbi:MAG: DUF4245 domain-containing protein [Pseudonocardia sp.]
MTSPPRSRDILLSVLVLLPLIGLVALVGRGCSFSPGGPTVDDSAAPRVDAAAALADAARGLDFPVRVPEVPPTWRANSTDRRAAPGGAGAVRVGWLTDGGRYLRLVQADPRPGPGQPADEGPLVAAETKGPPDARGVVTVAGQPWVRYQAPNGEQVWVRTAAGVRWLVTGSGTEAEFRTLAAAVSAAAPLPRG